MGSVNPVLVSYFVVTDGKISIGNYREVAIATFKYMSMLRPSDLSPSLQKETSSLSNIGFRFSEKRCPDDYAVWVADKLSWPVPRELVIKAFFFNYTATTESTAQGVALHTLEGLS